MNSVCLHNPGVDRTQLRAQLATIYIESQQRGWAELTELLAAEATHPLPQHIPALYNFSQDVYQKLLDAVKRLVHMHMVPSVEARYSATHDFELLPDDFDVIRRTLNCDAAYDLYIDIRAMLESSGSQWYLLASHSSTPRSRQEDTCVEEILSVMAWLPFLRRIRTQPLISELCQRFLLACSPDEIDYDTTYSASWDGFNYQPATEFLSITEAEARQQGEERRERAEFATFVSAIDRLLNVPTLHIPPNNLLSEEITVARAQLVKVCTVPYFLFSYLT